MTIKEATTLLVTQFPDMELSQVTKLARLMAGASPKVKREGVRMKVNGRYCRITAQIMPSHIGKRQRIYNTQSKSCRMWRESEAQIRGEQEVLDGLKTDRILWKEKYHKHFMTHIGTYLRNDPNSKLNKVIKKRKEK